MSLNLLLPMFNLLINYTSIVLTKLSLYRTFYFFFQPFKKSEPKPKSPLF